MSNFERENTTTDHGGGTVPIEENLITFLGS